MGRRLRSTLKTHSSLNEDQKIRYIHENPVQAGIVEQAEDYLYSSARNYAGLETLIEIEGIHS